jgi:hypothetical protein
MGLIIYYTRIAAFTLNLFVSSMALFFFIGVRIMHQIIDEFSREGVFYLRYTLIGLGVSTLSNVFIVWKARRLEYTKGD